MYRASNIGASWTLIGILLPSSNHRIRITPFCGQAGLPGTMKSATSSRKRVNHSISELATMKNVTPAQLALAWILASGQRYYVPTQQVYNDAEEMITGLFKLI